MEIEAGMLSASNFPEGSGSKSSVAHLLGAQTLRCLSDVIPVEEATAIATVAMSLKMMESVGCFTWSELSRKFCEQKSKVAEEKSLDLLVDGLDDAAAAERQLHEDVCRELLGKVFYVMVFVTIVALGISERYFSNNSNTSDSKKTHL